ncbi:MULTISPECIES: hypothetical protein [unclassified Ensifer]|uniref:hypothetical protein n=1 Tax=unclassified Ensifer TaxID=2633371 RepID=UPI00081368AD|nr:MULTISPECIES: hypothetical protein [unclassified Ensifer]OCP21948.1 hypothetical protein BC361_25605 [Ensifer sp. LC54]OCP23272.1 hypothetical protein BC363_25160 [Ensifer sp. LC384]
MNLKFETTQRGFAVATFTDRYGEECSLQASSLATEAAIWFGIDNPKVQVCVPGEGWKDVPVPHGSVISSRMHLTQDQVKALLPALTLFAETGDLPSE